jgi:hypothetical protein
VGLDILANGRLEMLFVCNKLYDSRWERWEDADEEGRISRMRRGSCVRSEFVSGSVN